MAFESPNHLFTFEASADLSASQWCGVVVNANGQLALPSAGARVDGFLQNKPAAIGEEGGVMLSGITVAEVGTGGVTAGNPVAVDAAGKVVAGVATNAYIGKALQTGAAGTRVAVLLGNYGTAA